MILLRKDVAGIPSRIIIEDDVVAWARLEEEVNGLGDALEVDEDGLRKPGDERNI